MSSTIHDFLARPIWYFLNTKWRYLCKAAFGMVIIVGKVGPHQATRNTGFQKLRRTAGVTLARSRMCANLAGEFLQSGNAS